MPDLDIAVVDAEMLPFAASPTIVFKLAITNAVAGEKIETVSLRTQIRLDVTKRNYDPGTQDRLLELFGEPHQWGSTLRSLLWTHADAMVPSFTDEIVFEMPVACTYDFEVVGSKYLHALRDGEVPLEFLFSGTVFYRGGDGNLQVVHIPWEKEAKFSMPVKLWQEMMDHYFPNSAWLRIHRDSFDRLNEYKVRKGLLSWEAALDSLMERSEVER